MIYYTLLIPGKTFFQFETFEELLREHVNLYFLKNKPLDFWLIFEPKFINNILNEDLEKDIKAKKYVCLLSTSKDFIDWIQLRLGSFEKIDKFSTQKSVYSNRLFFATSILPLSVVERQKEYIDSENFYSRFALTKRFLRNVNGYQNFL